MLRADPDTRYQSPTATQLPLTCRTSSIRPGLEPSSANCHRMPASCLQCGAARTSRTARFGGPEPPVTEAEVSRTSAAPWPARASATSRSLADHGQHRGWIANELVRLTCEPGATRSLGQCDCWSMEATPHPSACIVALFLGSDAHWHACSM